MFEEEGEKRKADRKVALEDEKRDEEKEEREGISHEGEE